MVWHIFRKDCRLLWRTVIGVALANLISRCVLPLMSGFASEGVELARVGAILATGILIVLAVHEDAIPGFSQDWLVRPIARRDLLLGKLLFVALLVQGPIFLTEFAFDLASGFPPLPSAWTALSRSLWMLLSVDLPVIALAAVTRRLVEALGAVLIAAVAYALFWDSTFNATFFRWTGSAWVIGYLQMACGLAATGFALLLQYRSRKTMAARWALGAAAVIWFAVQLVPWPIVFAIQEWFSRVPAEANRIRIAYEPDFRNKRGRDREVARQGRLIMVAIPLRIDGMGVGRVLVADRSVVHLTARNGKSIDAGQEGIRETFDQTAVQQGMSLREDDFDRIRAQPLTLRIDYSLTLMQPVAGQALSAEAGDRWIANVGRCTTGTDRDGAIEVRCIAPGNPPCTAWHLETDPNREWFPAMVHIGEVGIRTSRPCRSDYAPYTSQIAGESMVRVPTTLGSRGNARLMPVIYRAVAHLERQLEIRDVRLGDWSSEDDRGRR